MLWETFREEWGIWFVIAILLLMTLLFSNQLSTWLEKTAFIKVLDSLSKLGLLVAIIAFLREIPKWEERAAEEAKRRQFEYWKTIDAANAAREFSPDGRFTSYALKIALESLAQEHDWIGNPIKIQNIDLSGVNLEDGLELPKANLSLCKFRYANLSAADFSQTILHRTNFARARLFGTNFYGADFGTAQTRTIFKQALYDRNTRFPEGFSPEQAGAFRIAPEAFLKNASLTKALLWDADLKKANLELADLEGAILDGANCREANLQKANLQKANAKNVDFQGANLSFADLRAANLFDAVFDNANIQGAIFQGAEYMNVKEIKSAQNWELAIYDDNFRQELGLPSDI
ncbi:pentapeptide repeat-containing protein [Anabaena cylindrica UHCC 0172]|uniref:pentapeptide repeat-containing protein n=1 Tax=Anabaena cylindrica TaxID=1165 RepID=UPI002B1F81EE|nr:pentapeptide repeat-containing protein [Anabaena cylindrica]MEA5554390.1 pentapeptide repeat-containing protein [Anabaena cylindrica UHCC 0172]